MYIHSLVTCASPMKGTWTLDYCPTSVPEPRAKALCKYFTWSFPIKLNVLMLSYKRAITLFHNYANNAIFTTTPFISLLILNHKFSVIKIQFFIWQQNQRHTIQYTSSKSKSHNVRHKSTPIKQQSAC